MSDAKVGFHYILMSTDLIGTLAVSWQKTLVDRLYTKQDKCFWNISHKVGKWWIYGRKIKKGVGTNYDYEKNGKSPHNQS